MEKKGNILNTSKDTLNNIKFNDIFNIEDIQRLQDVFSDTNDVASIILNLDGSAITESSNYNHHFNKLICNNTQSRENCMRANVGSYGLSNEKIIISKCKNCGLLEAYAPIVVGGIHIANWCIGQVKNEEYDETFVKW